MKRYVGWVVVAMALVARVPAAGHLLIRARIIEGTGAFKGASGTVEFQGHELGVVTGSGTYRGRWVRGRV